jgi:hypothetical protein
MVELIIIVALAALFALPSNRDPEVEREALRLRRGRRH